MSTTAAVNAMGVPFTSANQNIVTGGLGVNPSWIDPAVIGAGNTIISNGTAFVSGGSAAPGLTNTALTASATAAINSNNYVNSSAAITITLPSTGLAVGVKVVIFCNNQTVTIATAGAGIILGGVLFSTSIANTSSYLMIELQYNPEFTVGTINTPVWETLAASGNWSGS